MRVRSVLLSLGAFALSASALPSLAASTATRPDNQPDFARVIVKFKEQAPSVKAKALSARSTALEAADVAQVRGTTLGLRHSAALRARLSLDTRTHVFTASGMSSAELAKRLASDTEVESVEVDRWWRHYATPNDPLYTTAPAGGITAGQWYLKAPDSTVLSSVNAPLAWDVTTGTGVVVAVLDTGVRSDHPDLAGQFVPGYDVIGLSTGSATALATANDGNGADSDPSDPGDWVDSADIAGGKLGTSCTSDDIENSSWHGTRVSGLIAAIANNGRGMAGLAYGAKILPVRVLGKCGGWQSDIEAGMRWAAGISVPGLPANTNKAKVINMSLGSDGACSGSYQSAVNAVVAAGAVVVAAAGNGVDDEANNNVGGIAVGTPANCNNVIGVAAVRHAGTKVGFSNLGPQVTLSAPGGNCVNSSGACLYAMLSTTNSGTTTPVANSEAYNYTGTGTSFATPLVSAAAAMLFATKPSMTPAEVKATLMSTARAFPSATGIAQCTAGNSTAQLECNCTTSTCGAGMLDVNAAVRAVVAAPAPAPSTPTTTTDTGSGGGGGGAMSAWWLAALAMATIALRWPARRKAAAAASARR